MIDQYTFHEMTFSWLNGALIGTDGGTIFGPVPRTLWGRYYPYNEKNQVAEVTDPILIQYQGKNYLIDASFNLDKFNDKAKKNVGLETEGTIMEDFETLGLSPEDIDVIMMTHMHNDHASGLTYFENDQWHSTFPNATIYMTEIEWDAVRHPNARTKNTYPKENWEAIQSQVETFNQYFTVADGITMEFSGGHSPGHAVIRFEQDGETMIHMADILLTFVHTNPLWVGGLDDYPMDSITAKQSIIPEALKNGYKFLFYHDPYYRVIEYTEDGKAIKFGMKSSRDVHIPFTEAQDKTPKEIEIPVSSFR